MRPRCRAGAGCHRQLRTGVPRHAGRAGYRAEQEDNLQLFVGDKTTLNFELEVGDVQKAITVSGEAPTLESATASRGGVIENTRVTELPLNGRNPFTLANLTTRSS